MADTLDIYESIKQEEEEPKAKGTAQIYEAIIADDPVKDQAKMNFNLAAEKNPDTEAKVMDLAEKTGRPAPLVRETMEDSAKVAAEPSWENLDPGVVQFLAESEAQAAQSRDDIENLGFVAKTIRYWKELGKDVGTSWKSGTQNVELGKLAFQRYILFDDSVADRYDALKAGQIAPAEGVDWFGYGVTAAAEMMPLMVEAVKGGVERGMQGAIIGGVGATALGLPIAAPAAALVMGGPSFLYGTVENIFVLESGLAADEFSDMRDESGNKLDPQLIRLVSVVAGGFNAGLEVASLGVMFKAVPGSDAIKRVFIRNAIKRAVKDATIRQALLRVALKFGGAVSFEGITEMMQEGSVILGGEILKEIENHTQGTAFEGITSEEVMARVAEAGKKAAAASATLLAAGTGVNVRTSIRDVQRAAQYKASQLQINEKVNESKTKERSPELMEKFLDTAGLGEDVFIKGDLAEEFFQQNPDIAEKIGLEEDIAAQAAAEGQDVKLKLSTLHAKLEAEEFAQVAAVIKPGPAALSEREAALIDTEEALDQLVEHFQAQQADEFVFQEDLQRLRGEALVAGRSEEEVDSWLRVVESFARRHADEGGELTSLTQKLTGVVAEDFVERPSVEGEKIFGQISPEQVADLDIPLELPTESEFNVAVENTEGAKVIEEGLLIDLVRYQKPEQEGGLSIRTGIFYLPVGSPQESYYRKVTGDYGGAIKFQGVTLLRRPLFAKGGTGGQAVIRAYDTLKGKNAYENMRSEVLEKVSRQQVTKQNVAEVLEKYNADPGLASDIIYNSRTGNTLPYAIQENIAAHAVRKAGYDSVVGWSSGKKRGIFISEVFDVRETTYPSTVLTPEIHTDFEQAAINASGESAASLEALAVEASRKAKGIKHVIVDTRSGETRPAIGPRPEDNVLNPQDILVQVEGDKAQVINAGSAVRGGVDWISKFQSKLRTKEFFQKQKDVLEPRGSLVVENDKYLIKLFERADKSTLIHETSHIFLEEIQSLVSGGMASKAMIKDWGSIQRWLGVILEEGITKDQQETFARTFETYLLEGKAPSKELETAFQRFRTWLVEIYKSAKTLNTPINNEIRGVFDRLLATEAEIDLYSDEIGLNIRTPKEMDALGLKEEDRAFLKRLVQGARDKAKIQFQKAKDRGQRKLMAQWRAEAKKDVAEQAIYKLRNDLAQKGRGLDIDLIREDYGPDMAKRLNAKRLGLAQANGRNPAEVAAEYDYGSVRAMLDAILDSQTQNERIEEMVLIKQQGHDGQFKADGPVLENDDFESYMEAMGRYIGKALGREERISSQSIKRYAERNLADMPLKEALRIDRFLAAMQRAMKQEREAISKGDFEAALQANRQARVNFHYARQVKKLQERVNAFERRSKRIARNKGTISINYLENLKDILRRFSVVKTAPVDPTKLGDLAKLVTGEEYFEDAPAFSDWLFARQEEESFKELIVDDFFELFNFVKYLEKKGRDEAKGAKLLLTSLDMPLDEALQQVVTPMKDLKGKKKIRQNDRLKRIKSWAREYAAGNKMLLFLMRAADGFSNTGKKGVPGANETLIYENIIASDNEQVRLRNNYKEALAELMTHFKSKIGNRDFPKNIDLQVPVPQNMAEEGLEWTFERVMAVAFNMGTEYNKRAIMEGYNLSEADLSEILGVLDKSDWTQIQKMWDMVNSFWGQLSEVYERRHGIRPPKVQATAFTTEGGQAMRGGYYPLRFDPAIDPQTQEREEINILEHSANAAFAPAPASGMLKKRRGTGGKPVNLSLSVLTQHLDYVTKYIAFAESIRDINRLISSAEYRKEFRRVMGEEFYKGETSIRRLLKDIIGVDRERMGAFDRAVNKGRNMATRYILGVNPSVALKQAYSLPGFVMDVGIDVYRKGLLHTVTNPGRAFKSMIELSPAMKDRVSRIDRDTMAALKSDTKRATYTRDAINFFLIHLVDGITVVPAWHGSYIQGMDMFAGDRAKAVAHADKTIAASQPFNRIVDMAYHQRSVKGAHVLFTMFSSFTMKYGNRAWYFTQGFKQGKVDWPTYLKHIAMERVLPPVLMSIMFTSLWGEEPEWEDLGLAVLVYQFIGLPFFRDVAVAAAASYKAAKGKGYRRDVKSPAFTAVELAQRAVAAAFQWSLDLEDPDKAERAQWAIFELLSFTTGVPASRVGQRIKRGMEQIENGEGGIGALVGIPSPNTRRK